MSDFTRKRIPSFKSTFESSYITFFAGKITPGYEYYCSIKYEFSGEHLHPLASRIVRDVRDAFDQLPIPDSTLDSLHSVYIWPLVSHITWSPSGYTPVGPDCPDVLPFLCLLITTWQLVKAHGVTRNEPKIHVISYITFDHTTQWHMHKPETVQKN